MHFVVKPNRFALLMKSLDQVGLDTTPILGDFEEAWPIAALRIKEATEKILQAGELPRPRRDKSSPGCDETKPPTPVEEKNHAAAGCTEFGSTPRDGVAATAARCAPAEKPRRPTRAGSTPHLAAACGVCSST